MLRVGDLDSVVGSLPFEATRRDDGVAAFEAPAGLPLGLVESEGRDFDLDHVVLSLEDPEAPLACFEELGFERRPRRDGGAWATGTCASCAAAPRTAGARS